MSFVPRYPQPFTFEQACALDVPTITEEISRLENSLEHLRETQTLLQEHIIATGGTGDAEISDALKENEGVIGSQEERIEMLKMALLEKGIPVSDHYSKPREESPTREQALPEGRDPPQFEDDDDGIHL